MLITLLSLSMTTVNNSATAHASTPDSGILLKEVVITAKAKKTKKSTRTRGEYMGFKLLGSLNTDVSNDLKNALASYTGPATPITSLRRHWGTKSQHERGRAVDFDLCPILAEYLCSEAGKAWLSLNKMTFMIEGRPGCREVKTYIEKYKEYIFFNPNATGPHIHIELN